MSAISDRVRNTLAQAADALRGVADLPVELTEQVATLANKVEEPSALRTETDD